MCNGLARPADESMLARDIGTARRSENIVAHGQRIRKNGPYILSQKTGPFFI